MIKTHTTRAHEFTSRAHDLHNMKKTHHKYTNTQDTACNSENWGKRDYIGNCLFENKITVKIASVALFDKLNLCVLTNKQWRA